MTKTVINDQYVLVTGGGGFIGSALVRYLIKQETNVIVLDLLSPNRKTRLQQTNGLIDFFDIKNTDYRDLFHRYNFICAYHLAGHADIANSVRQPLLDLHLNAHITLELLEAIRAISPMTKFIFASSAAVYGEGSVLPFEESDCVEPISPYGVHKLTAEHYLKIYHRLHGLRTTSLRLFPVYGPGQTRLVIYDLVYKTYTDPKHVSIEGDGKQVRDFIYVDDVVNAFIFTAENSPLLGDVYNVASGNGYSVNEIARMIADLLDVDARFVYEDSMRKGVSRNWLANTTKLEQLGYSAQTSLQDGLKATTSWIVSRGD